jgi:3-isopropylmalate dehydrogenase
VNALIALLPGDGIGPEVCRAGADVLSAVGEHFGHDFQLREADIGGAAIDAHGDPLPPATEALCLEADAILLGAVGGPKWSDPAAHLRPEQGLLRLRQALGVFANLRPIVPDRRLSAASPLRSELLDGVDICFVRELTGGIYFGDKQRDANGASDVCRYTVAEIERVVRMACELALTRKRRLVSVDKANVLETSRLWREITARIVAEEFSAVSLEHMLVDAAAMYLIQDPRRFDVVVTENMFGDILTDEASVITGSLGMLPSASLSTDGPGLYEPIHGSAPDIAGKGIANPFGSILSAALLLRHSLGLEDEARAVERAVSGAIDAGLLTPDLAPGAGAVSTVQASAGVVGLLKGEGDIRAIA